jgi:hypothetical protein
MMLPMASVRMVIPASRIHELTRAFDRRMAGEPNVRVRQFGSSLILASASMRCMTVLARAALFASTSTPAVSAIRPGRDEEGNVAGCLSISDSETDGHTIEEADLGWSVSFAGEIIAYEKNELVLASTQFIVGQQWLIRPPVGIGADSFQERRLLGTKKPEFNLHALGGAAVGGIEDMGAEPCRHAKYQGQCKCPTD